MLTKQDLNNVGKLIQTELEQGLEPIKQDVKTLKQDVNSVTQGIYSLKQDVGSVTKDVKTMKQDIKKIRLDQNTIIKFFDEQYLDLRQRVERLEQVVGLLRQS